MAVACGESKCWAVAGQFCKTPLGTRRRPHPLRVEAARRAGRLGGAGRAWLTGERLAQAAGESVCIGGTLLVLPPEGSLAGSDAG